MTAMSTMRTSEQFAPPSLLWSMLEPWRAMSEAATIPLSMPLLLSAPSGDGHPVMVLPGFMGSDNSTVVIRSFLKSKGYEVYPWALGRNLGPRGDLEKRMVDRVVHLSARHERKVSLVGWSLGGIFARQIARDIPRAVRQVVTLGSPFGSPGRGGTNASIVGLYEQISGDRITTADPAHQARHRLQPKVPCTAIYSRTDGVAVWQVCSEKEGPLSENVEVYGSHGGLGFNPQVLYVLANRLAQKEGAWQPYRSRADA